MKRNVPQWRVCIWSKENVTLEVKEEEKKREYNDNENERKKLEAVRERERERGNGERAAFRNNKWMKVDTSAWKFLSINNFFVKTKSSSILFKQKLVNVNKKLVKIVNIIKFGKNIDQK